MLDLSTSLALLPYLLAAAYALKLGLTGESYDGVSPGVRRKETIVAGAATAYTIFLFDAAGMKFVLLMTVILAPASLLYVKARSEHGRRLFSPTEIGALRAHRRRRRHRRRRALDRPHHHLNSTTKGNDHDRAAVSSTYGVHSEVGRLRKVLVCAPGPRAPPAHAEQQRRAALRRRDVGRERPARPRRLRQQADPARRRGRRAARRCSPRRCRSPVPATGCWTARSSPTRSGSAWSTAPGPTSSRSHRAQLAEFLIGGLATNDLPDDFRSDYISLARESTGAREYLMPPLPNTLYTRDTTCWLYGGLTMNPLYWPARKDETLIYKAIYQFHPDYVGSTVWWGDPEQDWGQATLRGRRRDAGRQRRRAGGHERAHLAPGDHPGRGGALRRRARPSG